MTLGGDEERGGSQTVYLARVNRRTEQRFEMRGFRETVLSLADAHFLEAERRGKTYYVGDIEVRGDLMLGLLGYIQPEDQWSFNRDDWSFLKGEQRTVESAPARQLAPFALDLDEHRRWLAFAPVGRVTVRTFPGAFQDVLRQALIRHGDAFVDWEVDVLSDPVALEEWVRNHPAVNELRLVRRVPNGRNITPDRGEMQALRAKSGDITYKPYHGRNLEVEGVLPDIQSEMVQSNVDVHMTSRSPGGGKPIPYHSTRNRVMRRIASFLDNASDGMSDVARVLSEYSAANSPPPFTGDPADERSDSTSS